MTPLRMRMIEDMKLAGLAMGTQTTYIDAVSSPLTTDARPISYARRKFAPTSLDSVSKELYAGPSRRLTTAFNFFIDRRSIAIGCCSQKKDWAAETEAACPMRWPS